MSHLVIIIRLQRLHDKNNILPASGLILQCDKFCMNNTG